MQALGYVSALILLRKTIGVARLLHERLACVGAPEVLFANPKLAPALGAYRPFDEGTRGRRDEQLAVTAILAPLRRVLVGSGCLRHLGG